VTAVRGFGSLEAGSGRPVRPDALFDLASLTKPIATAASVLALAEDGSLHLGEEVGRFLPAAGADPLEGGTLRHLPTHTSGPPAPSLGSACLVPIPLTEAGGGGDPAPGARSRA